MKLPRRSRLLGSPYESVSVRSRRNEPSSSRLSVKLFVPTWFGFSPIFGYFAFVCVGVMLLAGGVLWLWGARYLAEDTRRASETEAAARGFEVIPSDAPAASSTIP